MIIQCENVTKTFTIYEKEPGLKGVIKSFYNAKKRIKTAVDEVSFDIAQGEIVGYIGPNGAGKSTTIKMITGILTPTSGTVLVDGLNPVLNRKEHAKKIGVVFGQRTQLWWDLPLLESFTVLKEIYEVSDADYIERMAYFESLFQLSEFIKQPVRQLSLGQRMKADLVASLLHNPKLLFLDEPTIGLDVVAKENIRKIIKEVNKKYQTTVLLTTHDLADIEELCDRIIMIDEGKIIYQGDLAKVKAHFGSKKQVIFTLKSSDVISLEPFQTFTQFDKDFSVSQEANKLTIVFNKMHASIKDIVTLGLTLADVNDIDIQDDLLENIIKAIYKVGF